MYLRLRGAVPFRIALRKAANVPESGPSDSWQQSVMCSGRRSLRVVPRSGIMLDLTGSSATSSNWPSMIVRGGHARWSLVTGRFAALFSPAAPLSIVRAAKGEVEPFFMSIWQVTKRRSALRVLLFPVRVFVLVLLLASARTGLASDVFVEGFTDLPLMPGLEQIPDASLAFDSASGRIIVAFARGPLPIAGIQSFYAETLGQLGWTGANEIPTSARKA